MDISNVGSLIEPSPGLALFADTLSLFSPTPDKFQHQIRPPPRLHRGELSYPRRPPPPPPPLPPAVTRLRVTPRKENNSLSVKSSHFRKHARAAQWGARRREGEGAGGREGVLLLRLRYDSGGGGAAAAARRRRRRGNWWHVRVHKLRCRGSVVASRRRRRR